MGVLAKNSRGEVDFKFKFKPLVIMTPFYRHVHLGMFGFPIIIKGENQLAHVLSQEITLQNSQSMHPVERVSFYL